MSKSQSIQRILAQAKEKEKKYEWLDAAELHKKVLRQVLDQEDFLKAGDVQERIGYGLYRAAMQAENQKEFKERMRQAIEAYEKARGFYEKLGDEKKAGRVFRCKAVDKYLSYWLVSEAPEKRRLLNECWQLTREALERFEKSGDNLGYCKTFDQLSSVAYYIFSFEWGFRAREKIIREAMEYGERTIKLFSTIENLSRTQLSRGYAKTVAYFGVFIFYFVPNLDEKKKYSQKALGYWKKACKESGETAFLGLLSFPPDLDWLFSADELIVNCEKALDYARATRDRYLIGIALDLLSYLLIWKSFQIEDPDKRIEVAQRALKSAEDAKLQFLSISFISPRCGVLWTGAPHLEYYDFLAQWETDLRKKRGLLEKAIIYGPQAIKLAEISGYSGTEGYTHHVLSRVLASLAKIETDLEKRRLTKEALKHRKESVRIHEQLYGPFVSWNLGVDWNYLADIKAELSNLEKDTRKKISLLEEAISDKEHGVQLCRKNAFELGTLAHLGGYQYSYVELLNRLWKLTNNNEYQRKAIKVLEQAVESFKELDMVIRMAECFWKVGELYDALGEHLKAAENFALASRKYTNAKEKIPQLKNFYQDHASYMEAWKEIEKAKHHHTKKHYGQAKEHYKKAADLHSSTERWSYLGPDYLAWAQLEAAEDISRREQTEEAKSLFQQAAQLFLEAEKPIGAKLKQIEDIEEKEMAGTLAKASNKRREYCLGRVILEEAKILDRQGDHVASSKKYGSAAEIFEEIAKDEPEHSRKELQPIVYLCQAWQKMMEAEARASPAMYGEAAELFKEAKDRTIDQQTSLLALAHSSFCKALEAGTEFEITGDKEKYSAAKNHMEAAEKYYLKASFKIASEYAKATYVLFDAYLYMSKAETEIEPTKKAQYFQMAEKLLQASAGSYTKAKHPEKKEEVQRFLESIKEKRQLALSLTDVLHAPTIVSTTTSFSTPTPTHEKAVGLERFEHTAIEAHLTASQEATVEDQVEVRLDLANVAKEPGLLVRVDNLVPPSFKVAEPPSPYSVEDGSINLKGKKLEPLKVEMIKLSLRTTEPGFVNLNPQVIYVDELGKFRTSKPEPIAITVHPKLAFEFQTPAAQRVFSFLASSFVEDYMKRRISLEKSGWRTLMEIVKSGKVSKSSVYGAGGRRGRGVAELEKRGLVETRVFLGERGRGGKILKMRISYDKETIKRHIDQQIMKK